MLKETTAVCPEYSSAVEALGLYSTVYGLLTPQGIRIFGGASWRAPPSTPSLFVPHPLSVALRWVTIWDRRQCQHVEADLEGHSDFTFIKAGS